MCFAHDKQSGLIQIAHEYHCYNKETSQVVGFKGLLDATCPCYLCDQIQEDRQCCRSQC